MESCTTATPMGGSMRSSRSAKQNKDSFKVMNKKLRTPGVTPPTLFTRRWVTTFLILVIVAVVSGVTTTWLTSFARASGPTLTLSASSWNYNYEPDQPPFTVNGTGYGSKETVNVYFNYTGPGTGKLLTTAMTNRQGNFKGSFTFLGIVAPAGTYSIAGVGQTSGSVATAPFTFYPQIFLRPQAGSASSTTTVIGYSYAAGENVDIYWKYTGVGTGTLLGTATADSQGSFKLNITIPANAKPVSTTKNGLIKVGGVGQSSKLASNYVYTIYKPTLALAPLRGSVNTTLTLSAYGLRGSANINNCNGAGEAVSIFWDNGSSPVATAATSCYGYLPPTTITVPSNALPGPRPVKIVGQTSQTTITNTFTVDAVGSSLGSSTGPADSTVLMTGQGYGPNETVNIVWGYNGPGTGTKVGSVTASRTGTIRGSFTVPAATTGSYTVAALGVTSSRNSQNTFAIVNSLSANPASTPPGQSITVAGTGFQANETVQLYWDSAVGTSLATATADANGNVNQSVALPSNATPGSHTLIGVGATSGQSLTAPVTINTNWGDFGFDEDHHRANPYENILNPGNVGNLTKRWTATPNGNLMGSPVYANGVVYLATMNGYLNAYDALTGNIKWQFACQCGFRNYSSPLVDSVNNLVFFGTVGPGDEGIPSPFYALDAQTGQLVWSVILNWHQVGFPTLAFNTIFVGTSQIDAVDGSLYAIDEISGGINWQYVHNDAHPAGFWGAVAADPKTNTIFTDDADPDPAIWAFNATTGTLIWKYPVTMYGADDDCGSGITVDNGLVYASCKNGTFYAVRESDGTLAWKTPLSPSSNADLSTQAVFNGVVYVGSANFYVYALNATTGAIIWRTRTNGSVLGSVAYANGVVYGTSFSKLFYAMDASNGQILWSYTSGNISFGSPIVVNGWLYTTSSDGNLYAFSL